MIRGFKAFALFSCFFLNFKQMTNEEELMSLVLMLLESVWLGCLEIVMGC